MTERTWTVIDILNTARQHLEEKQIENPRGSAEALLCRVLNLPRIELYLRHDRPLTAAETDAYRELLRRRVRHEPLQLILGSVEFAGVRIEVRPGVLIPRPETEELVERVAAEIAKSLEPVRRVLDLGTGSGCIAVALAKRFPAMTVDAVDVDYEALQLAAHNARLNDVGERVRTVLCDMLAPRLFDLVTPPYDAVISNPPYVSERDFNSLAPEIRNHEPKQALTAGEDGLTFYRRIAELLPQLLQPGGILALEIGIGQSKAVTALLGDSVHAIEISRDMSGIPRMLIGKQRSG
jgi:release factor glutamine methyltransferase